MISGGKNLHAMRFFVLILLITLQLSLARKTSANQVPLGISRATGHAKAARLAGPRVTPTHRLAEQEKLKSKVFKQVAWKERMLEEKLNRIREKEEQDSLSQNLVDSGIQTIDDEGDNIPVVSTKESSVEKSLETVKRRPLLRKFLLKRRVVE